MSKHDKGRIGGQFTPLLWPTLDLPAWRALSHGAKSLYVALKRRVPRGRNRSYVSYRDAERELKSGRRKIREWFAELEHYGFIKLAAAGCLGVDGKGKAPHWFLTELGTTSKASAGGLFEPPTNDFLRWDGVVVFDPKPYRAGRTWDYEKQNPGAHVDSTPVLTWTPPPMLTSATPKSQSGAHVGDIEVNSSGAHVDSISSLTTTGASQGEASLTDPPSARLSTTSTDGRNSGSGKFKRRVAS